MATTYQEIDFRPDELPHVHHQPINCYSTFVRFSLARIWIRQIISPNPSRSSQLTSDLQEAMASCAPCCRALFAVILLISIWATSGQRNRGFPNSSLQKKDGVRHNLRTRYYTQTLDHFNYLPESYETFQQKYLISSDFWGGPSSKSPIFVYTGNEGDIDWFAQNTGFLFDNAPLFRALLVFIEHRYYGESMPFGSKDLASINASTHGFLSSAQALADYATLITDLKKNLSAQDSPVVVFGGSYGGMLAAWFRLKYPHITVGALSSSAPILYFENLTPPDSFDAVVGRDFKSESESCFNAIRGSWRAISDTASKPGGLRLLSKAFRTCRDLKDAGNLIDWLQAACIYGAMTDYPTESNFIQPLPAYPVKQMCKAVDNPSGGTDLFSRLYGLANIYYNHTGESSCFDLEGGSGDPHGLDGWSWQVCTEMVMPMSDNPNTSPFPSDTFNYTAFGESCQESYGVKPRPHWITTYFGGRSIKRVLKRFGSNIIFFNGLRDPWSSGGVLQNISESIVALVAEQGAHHVDLRFATKEDPQWLTDVRNVEVEIIRKWLTEYYTDSAET